MEPRAGFEPAIYCLRSSRRSHLATEACLDSPHIVTAIKLIMNRSFLVGQSLTPESCPPRKRYWALLREVEAVSGQTHLSLLSRDLKARTETCSGLSKPPAAENQD